MWVRARPKRPGISLNLLRTRKHLLQARTTRRPMTGLGLGLVWNAVFSHAGSTSVSSLR